MPLDVIKLEVTDLEFFLKEVFNYVDFLHEELSEHIPEELSTQLREDPIIKDTIHAIIKAGDELVNDNIFPEESIQSRARALINHKLIKQVTNDYLWHVHSGDAAMTETVSLNVLYHYVAFPFVNAMKL